MLKAVYDSEDQIPEGYKELYSERNGKWELTGVSGMKTTADIERVQASLQAERDAHKVTKDKLKVWGDLDYEEVTGKLDKLPELEAASKGKLDEAQIDEIVQRRVDGVLKSKTAPLERQLRKLEEERTALAEQNEQFTTKERTRTIHDNVRKALTEAKVIPDAHDDALLLADRVFEIQEDGAVVTRDSVGITPGLDPQAWLQEIQERRRHWWPDSVGGGAQGSGKGSGGMGANPWTAENWSLTEQGKVFREHGPERAAQMAKSAGTTVGGQRPPAKK